MNELIICVTVFVTLGLLRRNLIAPTTIFAFVASMNAIVYYGVAVRLLYPSAYLYWWQVKGTYGSVHTHVLLLFLILVILAFTVDSWLHRQLGIKIHKPTTKFIFESLNRIDGSVNSFLNSIPMALCVLFLSSLYFIHFWQIDKSKIFYYDEYLSIRQADFVGIENSMLNLVHDTLPLQGVLFSVLLATYFRKKNIVMLSVVLFPFLYSFLISVAFNSRFAPLQLFFLAFILFVTRRKKWSLSAALITSFGFLMYGATISLRRAADARIGEFGLAPFLSLFSSGNILPDSPIFFMLFNFFGGGFVMAEAFLRDNVNYPIKYKILSFSPLPSFIDGFDSVSYVSKVYRASSTGPFSNFAEAYLFGAIYSILFVIIIILSLYFLNRFWYRFGGRLTFVLYMPAFYAFARMYQYPLRHTLRYLLFSLLLCYVTTIILNRKPVSPQPLDKLLSKDRVNQKWISL